MVEPEGFGDRLRRLRRSSGLSQEELAGRAGLAPAAIGALERGDRRHPYPATVAAIAAALGLPEAERTALFTAVPRRGSAASPDATDPQLLPPRPLTSMVGRDRDIATIADLVQRSQARLVTLTGPPGVGKTRLAVELADRLPTKLGIGVAWVGMGDVRESSLALPAIARALSLPESPGKPATAILEGYLARRRLVLVLDGLEQLVAAGPAIAGLVGRCPGLIIIGTSREGLGVRGEHQLPVAPLGLPDPGADAAGVTRSHAGDLFVQRVRSVAPGFRLTDVDAPTIAAICRRLDGLPLALELAAAQAKYLPPASLLHRLDRRLAVLGRGPRDVPERHRSLRAAIEWSYELLDAPDQALFRRLSVFEGAFTEEAASEVCGEGGDLASLVDKSLVHPVPGPDDGARYALLETLREYARERLVAAGEEVVTADRHATDCCRLAERAADHLIGADRASWLRRLEAEWPNLRSALAWGLGQGDRCQSLRIAGALGWFWVLRGYVAEARTWTNRLLAGGVEACGPADRAAAAYSAAILAWKQGDHADARLLADESIRGHRALDDARGLALALAAAGLVAISEGDVAGARVLHEESLAWFRQRGERWGVAYGLSNLGDALRSAGDLAGARQLYDESLQLFASVGDPWGCGIVQHALASIDLADGDAALASARYADAVGRFRSLGNQENVARSLVGLGAAAVARGEPDEAGPVLLESLGVWRDLGSGPGVAVCLQGLAAVEAHRGHLRSAARLLGAAERHGEGGAPVFMVDRDVFLGGVDGIRRRLGESAFAGAMADGAAADLDSVLARLR